LLYFKNTRKNIVYGNKVTMRQ